MPDSCDMDVYRLITSKLVSHISRLGSRIVLRIFNRCVVSLTKDLVLCTRGCNTLSKKMASGLSTESVPATIGLPGGFSRFLCILGSQDSCVSWVLKILVYLIF
ncbi:hypothetical protein XELAEV_18002394mg [Xenopus laevis]|uniref:Uncharacterized protein n=1 Tax=Xenopus laevis TaxID=8355 RepID=A0A974BNR4_XENLA|nr:hypothetical protein XELAEV_18002394mg [Xenopus laevis]